MPSEHALTRYGPAGHLPGSAPEPAKRLAQKECSDVTDLWFVLLSIAAFAVIALCAKGADRL